MNMVIISPYPDLDAGLGYLCWLAVFANIHMCLIVEIAQVNFSGIILVYPHWNHMCTHLYILYASQMHSDIRCLGILRQYLQNCVDS